MRSGIESSLNTNHVTSDKSTDTHTPLGAAERNCSFFQNKTKPHSPPPSQSESAVNQLLSFATFIFTFLFAALHLNVVTCPIGAVRSVPRSVGWASSGVAFSCVGVDTAGLESTKHPSPGLTEQAIYISFYNQ